MIYPYEIDKMLATLEKKGAKIIEDDYIIVAHKGVEFFEAVYPLEIFVSPLAPKGAVYIMKRWKSDVTDEPWPRVKIPKAKLKKYNIGGVA